MKRHQQMLCVGAGLLAAMALTPTRSAQAALDPWAATWATTPEAIGGASFSQQTIREIVHTSTGGTMARIQISNLFGNQPLQIGDVHIARQSSGPTVTAGTDVPVTFGGLATTTIAAGSMAVSDPIPFTVPPLANVAISLYLPGSTNGVTGHGSSQQDNYIASGDVSSSGTLPGATVDQTYYFLADLDVQGTGSPTTVATVGGSLTDGYGSTANANTRWPDDLAVRLSSAGLGVGVANQGVIGNRLLDDGIAPNALARFDRDIVAQPGVRWVMLTDLALNDIASSSTPPAMTTILTAFEQLVARAHQKNIKVICSTLTPYKGFSAWTSAGESARTQFNGFVRGTSSSCDAVVDEDAAVRDPATPTQLLAAYDQGDHVDVNDAGAHAIANAVNLTVFAPTANSGL
jgi:lysophospholipase L1-like esterase